MEKYYDLEPTIIDEEIFLNEDGTFEYNILFHTASKCYRKREYSPLYTKSKNMIKYKYKNGFRARIIEQR